MGREAVAQHFDHLRTIPNAKGRQIACRSKCFACCIYTEEIATSRTEAQRIVKELQERGELKKTVDRARISLARRGKMACPLLARDGMCKVYHERPMSCRTWHSYDADACYSEGEKTIPLSAEHTAAFAAFRMLADVADPITGGDLRELLIELGTEVLKDGGRT
jgi:Fe-S-cluster containining protein